MSDSHAVDPYEVELEAALADDNSPPPPRRFAEQQLQQQQQYAPRLSATGQDLTPGRARRSEEEASVGASDPDVFPAHRRPFPSIASLLCTRVSLYAALGVLALLNLLVSPSQPDASCAMLQSYTLLMACLLLAAIPILAWNLHRVAAATQASLEVPRMPSVAWWTLSLMLGAALIDSIVAIVSIARNQCRSDQAMRQLALADIMIVLSVACATVLHQELRRRFPGLRFSSVSSQLVKAGVLLLCVAALVVDLTSLATHPKRGRTEYHFGLSARPMACVIDCPLPVQADGAPFDNSLTKRYPVCFDDQGTRVDPEWCANLPSFDDDHPLRRPCAIPRCDCNGTALRPPHCDDKFAAHHGHFWAQFNDQADQPLNAFCRGSWFGGYGSWLTQQLNCRSMVPDRSRPGEWIGQWDWSYRQNHDQLCGSADRPDGAPVPRPFDFAEQVIQPGSFPAAPCAQSCARLWVSAVIYSVVLGLACLALSLSLMCNCYRKQVETAAERVSSEAVAAWERTRQRLHPEQEGDAAATAAAAAAGAGAGAAAGDAEHPNPDHSHLPPALPAAAASASPDPLIASPPADAGLGAHCLHLGRLCFQMLRVLGRITVRGSASVAPLWRHVLLLLGVLVIVGFSVLSLVNMFWLVNSYCLDFLVSAILNATVTGALAVGAVLVLVRRREQVFDARTNPFEAVGLLEREDEDITEESSSSGHAGGAGENEERKEQPDPHAEEAGEHLAAVRLDELHAGAQVLREL